MPELIAKHGIYHALHELQFQDGAIFADLQDEADEDKSSQESQS